MNRQPLEKMGDFFKKNFITTISFFPPYCICYTFITISF